MRQDFSFGTASEEVLSWTIAHATSEEEEIAPPKPEPPDPQLFLLDPKRKIQL
jgi:hypothetical protein